MPDAQNHESAKDGLCRAHLIEGGQWYLCTEPRDHEPGIEPSRGHVFAEDPNRHTGRPHPILLVALLVEHRAVERWLHGLDEPAAILVGPHAAVKKLREAVSRNGGSK